MATKLFVGGLAWATREDALSAHFATVGTVTSASVIMDRATGKSKGFGFVEMGSEEEAAKAVSELNGSMLDGRNITVNEAKPLEPRENRPRSFGGNNRSFGGNRGGFSRDNRR